VALLTAPLAEAALTELRNAGGVLLARDVWRLRAAFGARSTGSEDGAAAVDVAIALLARVETVDAALRVGLTVRAGVASGPVWHHPADRLPFGLLVRGSPPDIAQRLVTAAPWGGLALDGTTFRLRAARLPGARPLRLAARRSRAGVTVFSWHPGRAR